MAFELVYPDEFSRQLAWTPSVDPLVDGSARRRLSGVLSQETADPAVAFNYRVAPARRGYQYRFAAVPVEELDALEAFLDVAEMEVFRLTDALMGGRYATVRIPKGGFDRDAAYQAPGGLNVSFPLQLVAALPDIVAPAEVITIYDPDTLGYWIFNQPTLTSVMHARTGLGRSDTDAFFPLPGARIRTDLSTSTTLVAEIPGRSGDGKYISVPYEISQEGGYTLGQDVVDPGEYVDFEFATDRADTAWGFVYGLESDGAADFVYPYTDALASGWPKSIHGARARLSGAIGHGASVRINARVVTPGEQVGGGYGGVYRFTGSTVTSPTITIPDRGGKWTVVLGLELVTAGAMIVTPIVDGQTRIVDGAGSESFYLSVSGNQLAGESVDVWWAAVMVR